MRGIADMPSLTHRTSSNEDLLHNLGPLPVCIILAYLAITRKTYGMVKLVYIHVQFFFFHTYEKGLFAI